jgi:hypothetical protein
MAFPVDANLIDDFNGLNGVHLDAWQPTKWAAGPLYGPPSGTWWWQINSSHASPAAESANHLSLFQMPADFELCFDLSVVAVSSGYLAMFFSVQNGGTSGWEGYWFIWTIGGAFAINKHVAGVTTPLATLPSSPFAQGDKIGLKRLGAAIQVYRRPSGGAWDQTPVINITDADLEAAGAIALEGAGGWQIDNLTGTLPVGWTAGGGGGGPPPPPPTPTPTTFYVNAAAAGASDTHTRLEAQDPNTPLRTVQAAGVLAVPGDTIVVEPAANANPLDAFDTHVYIGLHTDLDDFKNPIVPYGDNTGNTPITLQGHVLGDGTRPKLRLCDGLLFKNWVVQDFQIGYDRGSGRDYLTSGTLHNAGNGLTYRRVTFTGGGHYVVSWTGDLLYEDCTIYSPFSPDQGSSNFMDGAGFHLISVDTSDGTQRVGTATYRRCHFEDVVGEDCCQAGIGGSTLIVEDCTFLSIRQSGAVASAHTDCVQVLGSNEVHITGCWFLDCDSAFIASDGENNLIRLENNLVVGGGVQWQGQGTHEWIIRHNTILKSFYGLSLAFGGRTVGLVQKITMVNNIFEDFAFTDAIVDPASVVTNNICLNAPGKVTPYGTQLPGVTEFGTSARMAVLPVPAPTWTTYNRDYELSNDPVPTAGIGQGVHLADLTVDRLGRARKATPDCGCHESDPAVLVGAAARAPRVLSRAPASGVLNASPDTDIEVVLFAMPGAQIDPATVTESSFYATDPGGFILPTVSVSVGPPDGQGHQLLTLIVAGPLWQYVHYHGVLTTDVADTNGNHLEVAQEWDFRVSGPASPAVGAQDSGGEWTVGVV